jgi:PTH1 family peptidyl-tRNA hydrolase
MKLIVGLGNPGEQYRKTRHNAGFMVLDALAQQQEAVFTKANEHKAEIATLTTKDRATLMKPQTFMNLSGQSVASYANYFKLEPKDIWIISDDIDIPLGQIRVRDTGSSGGHNGLKSVIESLGTEDFYRIRVGVGQVGQEHEEPEASIFVLDAFAKREEPLLDKTIAATVDLLTAWLDEPGTTLEARTYHITN